MNINRDIIDTLESNGSGNFLKERDVLKKKFPNHDLQKSSQVENLYNFFLGLVL